MALLVVRGVDVLAVGAAAVATAMTVVYRYVTEAQGDDSALWWVQAVLVGGALLALVGAPVRNRRRVPVLLVATGLLGLLGLLAILTIGLPILLAAGLTFLAALRTLTRLEQPLHESLRCAVRTLSRSKPGRHTDHLGSMGAVPAARRAARRPGIAGTGGDRHR